MKNPIKRISAIFTIIVIVALSVIPLYAEQVGFKFSANQLLEMGKGLDAQRTLTKDTSYILCVTAWDEVGDDQLQYFVYFVSLDTTINTDTSTALTQTGGVINLNNTVGYIYRAEYNTTATGGYQAKSFIGYSTCTLRNNEIIVAYKDNGWRINSNEVTNNFISAVDAQPSARLAYTSYIQALMGFNGQYENSNTQNYDQGYADGYDKGEDDGYDKGYNQAYTYFNRVITTREQQAFDRGYNIGYSVGFEEGVGGEVRAYELPIDKIITAIPESIRIIIDNSLEGLKVGGVALGSFAIGLLVLGLIVTVVMWLWKVFK